MDKIYEPHAIEKRWYQVWEQNGYFKPSGRGEPYCIMLPPPNVTGTLHMGHAFQATLMDALIRYHRMRGFNTLWQPGMDHAGIATQMVVERRLNREGETRHALGREQFVERVWQWKEESGGMITGQLRRMGASVDWSRERFTMDEGLSRAVCEVFVRLYDEGLIYRGKRLVNWDPVLLTAVSDLEVVSQEEHGHLWHMRYSLADESGHLVVATTRPETMLGDIAVAVHPNDARYQDLIGKQVRLPLTSRTIPIIADDYVDPKFGTGCVKITPAHDFNDYAVGKHHGLPLINIFTADAHINDNGPEHYQGLDRFEARKRIVADLEAQDLLEKIEDHKFMVPRGDRTGEILEPYLTDQWFVKVVPLAEGAIQALEDGRVRFVPQNWAKTYFEWMRNIQDWCISRQLWWGHRIPAWYDAEGNYYVGRTEKEVRKRYASTLAPDAVLKQDEDVLDTWFSSALWPFSTLGWPDETQEFKTFYPTSVLVTGFDIIFFWVARMMMMGLKFMEDVPFREVYIHGLVRDAEGQKMSKSKGNVLDPIDLIDGIDLDDLVKKRMVGLMQPQMAKKIEVATRRHFPKGIPAYGADALRFTFAALATTGRDIKFDLGRIEGNRNFCNKLWNAARYVLMNVPPPSQPSPAGGEGDPLPAPPIGDEPELGKTSLRSTERTGTCKHEDQTGEDGGKVGLSLPDRWILSRLQIVEGEVARRFAAYRFDLIAQALYDFTWRDYCDWYLELSKPILQADPKSPLPLNYQIPPAHTLPKAEDAAISERAGFATWGDLQRGTRCILVRVLETLLRLLHPIMPFITEEIWQQVAPLAGKQGETIQLAQYPRPDQARIDATAIDELEWVKTFIMGVRRIRAERDIAPSKLLPALIQNWQPADKTRFERNQYLINALSRLESATWLDQFEPPESATALVGEMKILIPLAGLIDKEAELTRLEKEIDRLRIALEKSEVKLKNPNFIERAPEKIVDNERARVKELHVSLTYLEAQATRIRAL
jgi:valyl-tRNA synthetase